ncbi:aspartyl/asparaginyl beta-hydroxylase domain-containing protein [Erythrobacter sp.]|uniref:aspartyl/asparaginyl beta-hydroxylase domain-containing protein n=1 Tax=Erythrobacter sp. TaxID=1042 RepID=UPI001B1ADEA2|nr:aspartyl/asparaginyl beta-hydroxylase domain-containing protein [Erythrobacter sp.]MBO6527978.1 aspartyl/asparaginyl beta-hydroxylase domain-containing protein [Erythrobacter sp.]MBO6530360.1 aspartyl/asparaginyl beta-hydroxylase domain-containing protein [Erythrobacter sp.]
MRDRQSTYPRQVGREDRFEPPAGSKDNSSPPQARERYTRPRQSALIRVGKRLRDPVNRWFARQSLIGDEDILAPEHLPCLAELQREWRTVQAELEPLLAERGAIPAFGKLSPDHRRIANTSAWKSFFFEGYGFKAQANRARCPNTATMLDRIPGLVVAFFSIMEPGTHVPRHRGLTKAWLNCHLGLAVPQGPGRCEMEVNGRPMRWHEGAWLLFDETNPHEVWNETESPRVVLFLQVRRPMRWPGRIAARLLYAIIRRTGFVQDVKKAIEA